jgi:2-methylisocitrate lyase-like PEP mutase family enzyme
MAGSPTPHAASPHAASPHAASSHASTPDYAHLERLAGLARALRELHEGPAPLVLPNAWDALSARAIVAAGFPVVATSSSAVATALGYPDGEAMSPDEMFWMVRHIAASVNVPVTADLEAGYGLAPPEIVARMLDAGVVGLNIEDSDHSGTAPPWRPLIDPDRQAERITAIRAAGRTAGVEVFVNARVDVHLREVGSPSDRLKLALDRARAYRAAGADCIFPIWITDESTIGAMVHGVDAPVNVMLRPGAPSIARLAELGVRRISLGGTLARVARVELDGTLERLRAGEAPDLREG